jgi:hypothetical protein
MTHTIQASSGRSMNAVNNGLMAGIHSPQLNNQHPNERGDHETTQV